MQSEPYFFSRHEEKKNEYDRYAYQHYSLYISSSPEIWFCIKSIGMYIISWALFGCAFFVRAFFGSFWISFGFRGCGFTDCPFFGGRLFLCSILSFWSWFCTLIFCSQFFPLRNYFYHPDTIFIGQYIQHCPIRKLLFKNAVPDGRRYSDLS